MDFAANLKELNDRVGLALKRSGRPAGSVEVLAVSKSAPAGSVRKVLGLGIRSFGENRWQEAGPKIAELSDAGIDWHFIGRLQANKLFRIVDAFAIVESYDRVEYLEKADAHLAGRGESRTAFLQVNISREPKKGGFAHEEVRRFFAAGGPARFPRLRIEGLMGIGPDTDDAGRVRKSFADFRRLFDEARRMHPPLVTLSMGMSGDFEAAIEEGSTQIRVGTLIFGERN